MTRPRCRFPTLDGPCDRAVARVGDRCREHGGQEPVAAASELAKSARARRAAGRQPEVPTGDGRSEVPMSDGQVAAIAECLNRHEVEYVFIGGGAAQLHGAPVTRTRDADVVPSKAGENLDRLAAALRELDARLWVGAAEPDGLVMIFDRRTLGQIAGFLNLITRFGPIDITYRPDGTEGYEDLVRGAVTIRLLDVDVTVASLEDVIRSKEAAGRAKDIAALPVLIEHARRHRADPPR